MGINAEYMGGPSVALKLSAFLATAIVVDAVASHLMGPSVALMLSAFLATAIVVDAVASYLMGAGVALKLSAVLITAKVVYAGASHLRVIVANLIHIVFRITAVVGSKNIANNFL